ncbi:MAG: triose-phosphate isomerase [Candidatus Pacebacteria bacterium]|nr:triose-phosphate isomerase [Candidatus Paceibacterota bacterium]
MKHLILANWKMSPSSIKEARELFEYTKTAVGKMRAVSVVIAPPAVYIATLASAYKGNKVAFSAQSIDTYEDVIHTGALSPKQYKSVGAEYCLIGHSESGDTLDDLRVKTFLAIKYGLTPIVFVGESVRDVAGHYLTTIREQILITLKELSAGQINDIVFCYEPVWAVGQSEALDSYGVHQMALYIRKVLVEEYGASVARKMRILYGGSVKIGNISEILEIEDIDGVAVGRASTDKDVFVKLLRVANKA